MSREKRKRDESPAVRRVEERRKNEKRREKKAYKGYDKS